MTMLDRVMFWRSYRNFDAVIEHAPGPSPWYFKPDSPLVTGSTGSYRWSEARSDFGGAGEAIGKTVLRDPYGVARLILDFHCYVQPLTGRHLLAWHEDAERHRVDGRSIHLRLLATDMLPIIEDPLDACRRMNETACSMWFGGGETAHVEIPLSLPSGRHTFNWPDEFQVVDEVLILGHGSAGRASRFHDDMHLCIYVVRPSARTLEVIPQDWFNRANLDFGYQWVTRVTRDPETHRIFGDGIRIRRFVLRRSGRRVAAWR
jgi:hypothetical protein